MKHLTPQIIAEVTGGKYVGEESARDAGVAGVARDNRDVRPGNLFVCFRGERADGHSFANSAFDAGAACCLAEAPLPDAKGPYVLVDSTFESIRAIGAYHRSCFAIPVVGLTGSVGKTTTKELVAAVLGEKFRVLKTPGNLNNELGVPLTLLSLGDQHEVAVVEMGISDFGGMSRLADMVRPDIFIITSIGYAHLKELGDLNGVLRAKTEAFAYMGQSGVAVLNGDDELLREYDPGMRKITFGLGAHNDFRAENVRAEGTEAVLCDIASGDGRFSVKIPAYGSHHAPLAAAAAATGRLLGVADEDIRRGFLSFAPVGGRASVTDTGAITLIDDCYNANPSSVKAALASLSALPGRRVAILGDMLNLGPQSEQMHREIGVFAARSGIESLLCCGEESLFVHEGYLSGSRGSSLHFRDKSGLLAAIPELIRKGDAVLVKASRGMKFEELLPALKGI